MTLFDRHGDSHKIPSDFHTFHCLVFLSRILKTEAKAKFIPIVMFTVLGRDTDMKFAKESGCDGYFLKPFSPEDLIAEVKNRLRKTKQ